MAWAELIWRRGDVRNGCQNAVFSFCCCVEDAQGTIVLEVCHHVCELSEVTILEVRRTASRSCIHVTIALVKQRP